MDNVFLLTRPDHEELVSYLAQWCRELIDLANREGIGVIDCAGKRANKKEVNGILAKQKLKLIMFNGHGNYNIICGQNNEPIIILGDNEQLLVGKITYARVCCAAKNVGAAIAKAGKGTFIGYVESFYIYTDSNFASRQTSDEIAALFLNLSNEVIRALLKGHTAKEARDKSQQLSRNVVQKLTTSETRDEFRSLLPFLLANMDAQVVVGDLNATIR